MNFAKFHIALILMIFSVSGCASQTVPSGTVKNKITDTIEDQQEQDVLDSLQNIDDSEQELQGAQK